MKKFQIVVVALLVLSACAADEAAKQSADVLYAEAQQLAKGKRVEKAVERYQSLRTFYPGHELAKRSLIDLADLYYTQNDYEQAAVNYNEFRMLYPTDAEASYCLFRIGLCFFNRLEEYDRDQSAAVQTIQVLGQFVELYPASPYVDEARSDINVARSLIARQELGVVDFYIHKKKYAAACARLKNVAAAYGDLGFEAEIAAMREQACGKTDPEYSPTLFGRLRTFCIEHGLFGFEKYRKPLEAAVQPAAAPVIPEVIPPEVTAPATAPKPAAPSTDLPAQ